MKDFKEIKDEVANDLRVARWKVTNGIKNGVSWVVQNPEAAAIIIPLGFATVKGVGKTVDRAERKRMLKKEEELKDLYIYDRSIGTYLKMNRKPKQSEYIEIENRKRSGESLTQILRSMRLI